MVPYVYAERTPAHLTITYRQFPITNKPRPRYLIQVAGKSTPEKPSGCCAAIRCSASAKPRTLHLIPLVFIPNVASMIFPAYTLYFLEVGNAGVHHLVIFSSNLVFCN